MAASEAAIQAFFAPKDESAADKARHALEIAQLITRLNGTSTSPSTLILLKLQVEAFFYKGPLKASFAFEKLRTAAIKRDFELLENKAIMDLSHWGRKADAYYESLTSWHLSHLVTGLVVLHAARPDKNSMYAAASPHCNTTGGRPTAAATRTTPSASLRNAFQTAKAAALGPQGVTTIMAVDLADAHWLEQAERGGVQHLDFAHVFALGIGPENVVMWQSWGMPGVGYSLPDYLERAGGRIREWKEGDDFVDKFEKLIAKRGGPWTAKRNKLYEELFEINLFQLLDTGTTNMNLTPRFQPWVRVQVIANVQASDVTKYHWI